MKHYLQIRLRHHQTLTNIKKIELSPDVSMLHIMSNHGTMDQLRIRSNVAGLAAPFLALKAGPLAGRGHPPVHTRPFRSDISAIRDFLNWRARLH